MRTANQHERRMALAREITLLEDRRQAGILLAERLQPYLNDSNCVVVGIANAGVPVAAEVARKLRLPLDVCLVRKFVYPYRPEMVLGAVGANIVVLVNNDARRDFAIPDYQMDALADEQEQELVRREMLYRRVRSRISVTGRTVILVDDLMQSGATMSVAIRMMKNLAARRVIVAAGIASQQAVSSARPDAEDVICLFTTDGLLSPGKGFRDARPVHEREVRVLLAYGADPVRWNVFAFPGSREHHRRAGKTWLCLSEDGITVSERDRAHSK